MYKLFINKVILNFIKICLNWNVVNTENISELKSCQVKTNYLSKRR